MASGPSQSPDETYQSNFPQQLNGRSHDSRSPPMQTASNMDGGYSGVPRPKRIACVICRKRKLRCDGGKPSCGTCARLAHDCSYDEVRRKSGPKRGYVKQLEARLAQVETLLKTQDPNETPSSNSAAGQIGSGHTAPAPRPEFQDSMIDLDFAMSDQDAVPNILSPGDPFIAVSSQPALAGIYPQDQTGLGGDDPFSWELIGQGLEEPLPRQEVIDELHQIYFEKMHPSVPMIHRPRYLAAMNLAPHLRPPICLRYAIWCLAASISEKYSGIQDHFYQRARKYAENDEMKGHGESFISAAHSQTWVLIATYEFKLMYFPRAWMSTGRGVRLAQMMGLHRLDGVGLDVKQCLPPPKDWTEREERRRTFWMAFCEDRYASIGTGWPVLIDEKDILTNLPATEEAYLRSRPQRTLSLIESMNPEGAANLSSFAGVCMMACLFGRNLTHLHRPDPNDRDDDLNGEFWKRHRQLDNIILNTSLSLPSHLRLPAGVANANIVFLNMNIHTSTICLHQAAIFKSDQNRLPPSIASESKTRCILAAAEIAGIMRMVSHMDVATMNPFIAFCLYVAARVFVQYLKSRPEDQSVRASLEFLLGAMRALKRTNPLTESFLIQLDVDLGGNRTEEELNLNSRFSDINSRFSLSGNNCIERPTNTDRVTYSALFEPRPAQNPDVTSSGCPPLQTTNGSPMDFNMLANSQYRAPHINLPNRQKASHESATVIPCKAYGLTPFLNNVDRLPDGEYVHRIDMEATPNNCGSEHHSSSGHPTPSTISNKSSQTSYSPPHIDETSTTQYHSSITNITGVSPSDTAAFFESNAFAGFYEFQEGHSGLTLDKQTELSASLPTETDSLDEAGWVDMLNEFGWDTSASGGVPFSKDRGGPMSHVL